MVMPSVNDVIAYENGEMDESEAIEFFQGMINSGVVWQLQGAYGRTAMSLIEVGACLSASDFAEDERVSNEALEIV